MEAPKKLYLSDFTDTTEAVFYVKKDNTKKTDVEYTRADDLIERVINFLSYKLDDIVATRVPGTIIPHHVAKQELIEDLKKYMKGE